jgi:hypothetical protein
MDRMAPGLRSATLLRAPRESDTAVRKEYQRTHGGLYRPLVYINLRLGRGLHIRLLRCCQFLSIQDSIYPGDRPDPGGDYAAQRNECWCQLSAVACLRWRGPAARPTGGLWIDLLVLDREGGMNWRVMIELVGAEGTVPLHEVSAGGSTTAECSAETLG